MYPKIALLMTMEGEALPLIEKLSLRLTQEDNMGFFYEGQFKKSKLSLTLPKKCPKYNIDSVGTEIASVMTLLTIQKFSPDLIINLGTSGGISLQDLQLKVGEVCFSKEITQFCDRKIELEMFKHYDVGKYEVSDEQVLVGLSEELGFKGRKIVTRNSFIQDYEAILQAGGQVVEMEAAAVNKMCCYMKVPFFALKVISDVYTVGGQQEGSGEQFEKHFEMVNRILAEKAFAFLEKLCA